MAIKITSTSEEQFKKVREMLDKLPKEVLEQVKEAEMHIMATLVLCKMEVPWASNDFDIVYIPKEVEVIQELEGGYRIFTSQYTFTVEKKGKKLMKFEIVKQAIAA